MIGHNPNLHVKMIKQIPEKTNIKFFFYSEDIDEKTK